MSKLTDLKLKQQAITEWWAWRRAKQAIQDQLSAKIICISIAIGFLLFIILAQAWAILDRMFGPGSAYVSPSVM
ncbi:MAG: hypothetical protein AAFY08_11755 [Planctomycetota bacterium]